ncbi:DoxX family protein [Lacisediminihabitans sp. FW035]
MRVLWVIEVIATVGLVAGIWFPELAIAATIGVIAYFVGAIISHRRASDPDLRGAVVFLGLAVVTLIVVFLSR